MMGASFVGFDEVKRRAQEYKWTQRFAWLPKRTESGQRIWLKRYWYGTRLVFGIAGETPVRLETRFTEEEYMWHKLTEK